MKYLWLFLVCTQLHAAFKIEGDEISPFTNNKYPLKEFIKDYAELMKLNVTYASDLIKENQTLHIQLNTKVTKGELKKIFFESLDSLGYTSSDDSDILFLFSTRDIRYLPTKMYVDQSFPKDASYSTVLYRLKYPLSAEITRNLRPFLSRYGRVVDLSDAKTLILNDRGDNVERILQTIASLDTEAAYQDLITYKPKKSEGEEVNPLQEKVMDLELEKKLLEKKYLEVKGEHP